MSDPAERVEIACVLTRDARVSGPVEQTTHEGRLLIRPAGQRGWIDINGHRLEVVTPS